MKFTVLGCYGGRLPGKILTSFLIDDSILVDAGGATAALDLPALKKLRSILVSHSHLDHIADTAMIGDLIIGPDLKTVEIIGLEHTLSAVKDHLMSYTLWPDFTEIPTKEDPVYRLRQEEPRQAFQVGDYEVELVMVNHPVPCAGMVFRWDGGSFIYTADTGITDEIWEVAKNEENLKGLVTEISFPNSMKAMSEMTGHYSPCHIDAELAKIGKPDLPVYIYHFKPAFEETLLKELAEIEHENIRPLVQGETIEF
jgi:cAMP phosphodiesterase